MYTWPTVSWQQKMPILHSRGLNVVLVPSFSSEGHLKFSRWRKSSLVCFRTSSRKAASSRWNETNVFSSQHLVCIFKRAEEKKIRVFLTQLWSEGQKDKKKWRIRRDNSDMRTINLNLEQLEGSRSLERKGWRISSPFLIVFHIQDERRRCGGRWSSEKTTACCN